MVNDLRYSFIQKPLLVDHDFNIITGDTRHMALQVHKHITHVSALMSAQTAPDNWVDIQSRYELAELLDIDPKNIITNSDWSKQQLDWIEFAYPHTENHMHDEDQRTRMIENYLQQHPDTVFDKKWLSEIIDWKIYDF